jgi:hypothetical protein
MAHRWRSAILALLGAWPMLAAQSRTGSLPARLVEITVYGAEPIPCRLPDPFAAASDDALPAREPSLLRAAESAAENFGEWHPDRLGAPHAFQDANEGAVHAECSGCGYYRRPAGGDMHGGGYCGHE